MKPGAAAALIAGALMYDGAIFHEAQRHLPSSSAIKRKEKAAREKQRARKAKRQARKRSKR